MGIINTWKISSRRIATRQSVVRSCGVIPRIVAGSTTCVFFPRPLCTNYFSLHVSSSYACEQFYPRFTNRDTKTVNVTFSHAIPFRKNVCNVTTRTIEITPAPSRHTGQTVVWLHGPQRRTENDEKRNSMALRLYGVCAVSALGHDRGATADRSSYYAAATHSNFSPTRTLPLIQ